ncbi:MAG TPA: lysophospholipase [Povalibacter sp.]
MPSGFGISNNEEFIESGDRQQLFVRSWRPDHNVRAALAIVHGFNSHGAYYEHFANAMANRGIAVYAVDLRGRGQSSGPRFDVQQFSDYVDDVHALVSTVRAREPSRPVFLLGHSAGGLIACEYALYHQQDLAGLICESFALDVPAPAAVLRIVRALAIIAPRVPVLTLSNVWFSRDESVVARMNNDVLIKDERQPARTVAAMVRASTHLRTSVARFSLPLLILHGSADAVTLPSGSEYFHEHAGSRDKTLQIFEGYYHDLINDHGHEHVVGRIHQWIEARLGTTAQHTQIGIAYINPES